MSDTKPQVFPTKEQQTEAADQQKVQPFVTDKEEINRAYVKPDNDQTVTAAAEAMRKRTEEQIKIRDEQLKKNLEQAKKFDEMTQNATSRQVNVPEVSTYPVQAAAGNNNNIIVGEFNSSTPVQPPVFVPEKVKTPMDDYIQQLSQPDFNSSFDVIPLPSEGKIYGRKRPNVRVSYMTTTDEDILTSPNILQSGEFLEILINRKLLEPDLRYKDLHSGDRDAIMLWLRATGYGEMYPVTLLDEKDVPFETSIDLNTIKSKKLGAEPNEEGYFDFTLPISKAKIKFRLLNIGDTDEINKLVEADKAKNDPINHTNTYKLERSIVEVNGSRDKEILKRFSTSLRLLDGNNLVKYIDGIESGVDLNIEVGTPGGSSVKTFLPINFNFFWPNIRI